MAIIILVHGAWHGAWCWERIAPLLEANGHSVIAPDLPGMGADKTALSEVTLAGWARFIADIVSQQDAPVVLVGHSRAGVVISQVAEYVPDRIAGLVYLAAFLVPNGQSMRSTMLRIPRDPARLPDMILSDDGISTSLVPGAVERTFYDTTDQDGIARATALAGPEPVASIVTPLTLTEERYGSVRRAYIECLRDEAVSIDLQKLMQADLPCAYVETIDSDHSPFFSAPSELADHLSNLAGRFVADQG